MEIISVPFVAICVLVFVVAWLLGYYACEG